MTRRSVWKIAGAIAVLVCPLVLGCSKSDRTHDVYKSVRSAGQLIGNRYYNELLGIDVEFPSGARVVEGTGVTDSSGVDGVVISRDNLFVAVDTAAGALVMGRLPRGYEEMGRGAAQEYFRIHDSLLRQDIRGIGYPLDCHEKVFEECNSVGYMECAFFDSASGVSTRLGAFAVQYEEIFFTVDVFARESVFDEYRAAVFAGLCHPTGRPVAYLADKFRRDK